MKSVASWRLLLYYFLLLTAVGGLLVLRWHYESKLSLQAERIQALERDVQLLATTGRKQQEWIQDVAALWANAGPSGQLPPQPAAPAELEGTWEAPPAGTP